MAPIAQDFGHIEGKARLDSIVSCLANNFVLINGCRGRMSSSIEWHHPWPPQAPVDRPRAFRSSESASSRINFSRGGKAKWNRKEQRQRKSHPGSQSFVLSTGYTLPAERPIWYSRLPTDWFKDAGASSLERRMGSLRWDVSR
ncbi:hypothetical protein WOLCODRAFT_154118 [Wolfiporia cocos MD-104 SS10]|uniref:Uncharacterized protein n=1 Tax=Wolfiporia cocos (strain MD-104) TaxID=742152 RepID=A0A2H3K1S4_WOLCO|nr:hypothetical protein WOLCODRAFT_154118 [Wolfiporia cocos MD-104 SS10]